MSQGPAISPETALLIERKSGRRIDAMLISAKDPQLSALNEALTNARATLSKHTDGFHVRQIPRPRADELCARWGMNLSGSFQTVAGKVNYSLNPSDPIAADSRDPSAGEVPGSFELFTDVFRVLNFLARPSE